MPLLVVPRSGGRENFSSGVLRRSRLPWSCERRPRPRDAGSSEPAWVPRYPSRLGYLGTAAIVLVAAMLGIAAVGSWLEGASLCRDDDHVFGVVLSVLLALLPIVAGAIVARRTLRWGLHPSVRAVSAVVAGISLPLILYYAVSTAVFGPVFCPL